MAAEEGSSAHRMSDAEALMWNLEKDPRLSASMANLTLLDRPPDRDRLRARMALAVEAVPRLRQRVVHALGRLAPPEWCDDPDFDLDRHLRWVALPAPGDDDALLELAARLAADPFDRTRPLWEFVVVEGRAGGKAAMVQRLHHTITDGEGGVRMSAQFLDIEPDAEGPLMAADPVPRSGGRGSLLETAAATFGHTARRGIGVARRAVGEAVHLATTPSDLARTGTDAVATARSIARQVAVTDPARSPLWRERTLRRRVEILSVPFDEAKEAAGQLGGSLNDLFVAAACGGAGAYHRARDVPVDELRMAMPISTRKRGPDGKRSAGGNAFSPTRLLVPAGIEDPRARFEAVRDRVGSTRGERAVAVAEGMAGLVNMLPTSVLVRLVLSQVSTVDFTTSNVRGAPFDLYIAGARMEGNHPLGPLGGTAWNLTLMSYAGRLDMGLHVDAGAVEAPAELRDHILGSFDELLAAGAPRRRASRRRPASA